MPEHTQSDSSNSAKPCRTCTDFKTWAKMQRKNLNATTSSESTTSTENPSVKTKYLSSPTVENSLKNGCPLDRETLGHYTWGFLHTVAATYSAQPTAEEQKNMKQFFTLFGKIYPCSDCAEGYRQDIQENPPKVDSQESLSQWLCNIHNKVNEKINKPLFDCSKVNQRWKDGWLDGSCN